MEVVSIGYSFRYDLLYFKSKQKNEENDSHKHIIMRDCPVFMWRQ